MMMKGEIERLWLSDNLVDVTHLESAVSPGEYNVKGLGWMDNQPTFSLESWSSGPNLDHY